MEQDGYQGLQVHEDMGAQRRIWRVQRIGWALLALFLAAGLLGLLGGNGVLQEGSVASADGNVLVRYPRFDRYVAPTELRISVHPALVREDALELTISRGWFDVFELYGISPRPEGERVSGDDIVFRFAVTPGQGADFTFSGRAHHVGRLPGSLRVGGSERLEFSTFVFP